MVDNTSTERMENSTDLYRGRSSRPRVERAGPHSAMQNQCVNTDSCLLLVGCCHFVGKITEIDCCCDLYHFVCLYMNKRGYKLDLLVEKKEFVGDLCMYEQQYQGENLPCLSQSTIMMYIMPICTHSDVIDHLSHFSHLMIIQ